MGPSSLPGVLLGYISLILVAIIEGISTIERWEKWD